MERYTGLTDIVEVAEVHLEEEANRRLRLGWVLLDAKIEERRTAPHFTEYPTAYLLGRPRTVAPNGDE